MVIKSSITIIFVTFSSLLLGQYENQKKYFIEKSAQFKERIVNSVKSEHLASYYHSTYTYSDVYLDTPGKILLKKGYSLRFRRREKEPGKIGYSFQLKSEMDSTSISRIEIDEPELYFYKVKTDKWYNLTDVLDSIWDGSNHRQAVFILNKWIKFKAGSTINPFQALIAKNILNEEEIKMLIPVIKGVSTRYRSHIYMDTSNTRLYNLGYNKISDDKMPVFFKTNREFNWMLETSFDLATFYTLEKEKRKVNIVEFEVENKYYDESKIDFLINLLEVEILENYVFEAKLDSKYKQSMKKLF